MRITVSGPPGSGTTTLCREISKEFDLEWVSSGDVFREMARERDVTLEEFNEIAENDPEIDKEIDLRQKEIGREHGDIVLEGRLSGWMVEEADLRIWLDAPLEVRAERVSIREDWSEEQTHREIKRRAESEALRYREIHGIDISDLSLYDLVLNTEKWSEEGVSEVVGLAIKELNLD